LHVVHKANTLPTDNGVCRVPLPHAAHRTCSEGKCNTRHARSLSAASTLSVYALSCALTSSSHLPLHYIIYLSCLQEVFRIFSVKSAKSFDQTFTKVCAGGGREALLASAEAKYSLRCFNLRSKYVLLCGCSVKKNGNDFLTKNPNGCVL